MKRQGVCAALALAGLAVAVLALTGEAHAAQSPFGIATPDGGGGFGGPLGPFFSWIALRQAEFYKGLTASLKAIKENGSAAWLLVGLSFAYGVFHAAGPGHGKAVITSYLLASGDRVRRGIAISFAAALAQAATAILIVAVASLVFRATAQTMTAATDWLEIGSYALIAAVGAWLLWSKTVGGHHHHHHHQVPAGDDRHDHHHAEEHERDHHDHSHGHAHHDHAHDHHARPVKSVFARPLPAILAVGIRPCSGAIIVLVFALAQGLFAAGIAATLVMAVGTGLTVAALATLAISARGVALRMVGSETSALMRMARGIEIAGAAAVLLLGLTLLGGALSAGLPS